MAMQRVKFTALPDESGPVSPDRLDELQDNVEEYIDDSLKLTGLNEGKLPTLNNVELNTLEAFNGFRYIVGCTVNGETIANGYFLQLIYTENAYRIQIHIGATSGKIRYRIMKTGTWEDFASIGKQITVGQEEPTNEFIGNKRVYVKRIDCGTMPNSTSKLVAHGLSNVKIEHFEGIMRSNDMQVYNLPHVDSVPTNSIRVQINSTNISITTARDWSAMTATIDIYYTKNS